MVISRVMMAADRAGTRADTTTGMTTMTTRLDTTATISISHHPEEVTLVAEAAAVAAAAAAAAEEVEEAAVEATFMRTKSEWWPVNRARMSSSSASTMTSQKPTSVLTCSSFCARPLNPVCSLGFSPPLLPQLQAYLTSQGCHLETVTIIRERSSGTCPSLVPAVGHLH